MKKLVLVGIGLFTMAGFLPAKGAKTVMNADMACIWTSCLGTMCHDDFHDIEFATDVIEFIEDNMCN